MPTRCRAAAWIAAVGLLAPALATGQDRTERELIDLIVREGPASRAIQAEPEVARREQLARLAWPNPSVTYTREGAGFTEFLQAEQWLPLFGTRAALARAGQAAASAAAADRDVRLAGLRFDAAAAVARFSAGQARLEAADTLARQVEQLIDLLRVREREGEGSRFDRLRAEQELRDVRQLAAAAAAASAEARAALSALLPASATFSRIVRDTSLPAVPAASALHERAKTGRAELRAVELSARRAMAERDAARRSRLPSPTLFGGFKRADEGAERDTGAVIGVGVAVPLFDAGAREAARWSAEAARLDAERSAIEQRVRSEVAGALEVLLVRQAALAADQPGEADELVEIAQVAYREGEAGILELLDSIRTASRARVRSIDLWFEARAAQLALERAVGETLWP